MTIAINDQGTKKESVDNLPDNIPDDDINKPRLTTTKDETETHYDDLKDLSSDPLFPQQQQHQKSKSAMCLINELTRYNGISHEYKLIEESGPPHAKLFKVVLRLGDNEEFVGTQSSIRRAQHAAAEAALVATSYTYPSLKKQPKDKQPTKATPTAELNVLAMKRGERVSYNVREPRTLIPPHLSFNPQILYDYRGTHPNQRYHFPKSPYVATCNIGDKIFEGTGLTPQGARHSAAVKALQLLRNELQIIPKEEAKNDDEKSPVSRVHELAKKMAWDIKFDVTSSTGPTHLPLFVMRCTVSSHSVEGEGNNKKVAKKKAAEQMLDLLQSLPEVKARLEKTATIDDGENKSPIVRPDAGDAGRKRPVKIIELRESLSSSSPSSSISEDDAFSISSGKSSPEINPINYLAQYVSNRWKTKPKYHIIYIRIFNRKKKELVVECSVKGEAALAAVGIDVNEKVAKRKAAEAMLQLIHTGKCNVDVPLPDKSTVLPILKDSKKTDDKEDKKKRERKVSFSDIPARSKRSSESKGDDVKSSKSKKKDAKGLPPGVLRVKLNNDCRQDVNSEKQKTEKPKEFQKTQVSGSEDERDLILKLQMKLANGFQQETSPFDALKEIMDGFGDDLVMHANDFPKNKGSEFLTVITITTDPPIICHGSGQDVQTSRAQAALEIEKHVMSMDVSPVDSSRQEPTANCTSDADNI